MCFSGILDHQKLSWWNLWPWYYVQLLQISCKNFLIHPVVSNNWTTTYHYIKFQCLLSSYDTHTKFQDKQSVIFIDEIDSVCRERSSREEEYTRRVKNELLKQIEGIGGNNDKVFLLCATNCPWELDTAFLRRLSAGCYSVWMYSNHEHTGI